MAARRRHGRWVAIALLLTGTAWALYALLDSFADLGPDLEANQLLLPALSLFLVALVLALAGVLIRNLVRLIVDRKRGLLGARLRTKLVFFFLALVLVPAIVLSVGSAHLIKQTVEAILRTPLEDLTTQSGDLVANWRDYLEQQTQQKAAVVAREVAVAGLFAPGNERQLERKLRSEKARHDLDLLRVRRGDEVVLELHASDASDIIVGEPLRETLRMLEQEVVDQSVPAARTVRLGDRQMSQAAVPAPAPAADTIVTAGVMLPLSLSGNLEGFAAANQAYRQFRAKRKELVRFYLMQIALIFLVTVFIATWIGFYISRRITEPIQEMAAAAKEISQGNLQVRIQAEVGDEVGTLVDAFNEMAGELEESRAVINRSTADLRRSNREIEERRRYIETLLENLSTAVISLDRDGRVTTANPVTRTILGVDLVAGDRMSVALRAQGFAPLADLVDRAAAGPRAGGRRDLSLDRDERALQVAVQVSPLSDASGERLGTLVMVEDLSDLVRAQRAAAWREVARRIAHEIKNPLTPIQLAAQRLRRKFAAGADDLDRVVPDATASIEREVGALKQLVDEFSRFARMPEVTPRPVDFREVVNSVLALYEGLGRGIHWEVDLDGDLVGVVVDDQQMRRALINLIDNAVAALEGNGTIRISAHRMRDRRLRVEVADDGPGIPAADRDKMFMPYFSTKKRGTGLGLAIVHRVITDHGGTIRVEDNVPQGARFVIELPNRAGVAPSSAQT